MSARRWKIVGVILKDLWNEVLAAGSKRTSMSWCLGCMGAGVKPEGGGLV